MEEAVSRFEISKHTPEFTEWVRTLMVNNWGSDKVVSRGRILEPVNLPGLVALLDGVPAGYDGIPIEHEIEMEMVFG